MVLVSLIFLVTSRVNVKVAGLHIFCRVKQSDHSMRIYSFLEPGAGKGTQLSVFDGQFGIPQISTGRHCYVLQLSRN